MGYLLHIVRTSDWQQAEESPITKEEVVQLVEADSELEWSAPDYVEIKVESEKSIRYSVKGQVLIKWRGVPWFWWHQGEISCKNPNEDQIAKLIRMADILKAHVIGDEDERYTLRRSFWGREKIEIRKP